MDNINIKSVIKNIIKNTIKNNLKIRITADYNCYIDVELLYNDEVIDSSTCKVIISHNTLEE